MIKKFAVGEEIRIRGEDNLEKTRIAHTCATRMYEMIGGVYEVFGRRSNIVEIYDEVTGWSWMFHPDDIEYTEKYKSPADPEPVLFDINNLI